MSITPQAAGGYRRDGFAMIRNGTSVYLFARTNQDNGEQEWFAHSAWNNFRDASLEVVDHIFDPVTFSATIAIRITAEWGAADTEIDRHILSGRAIKM
jgi:hypothetical protein